VDFSCLSVFSGVGMLDLGFGLAIEHIGARARTVGYVERDAYAAACLLARMDDEGLEPAPIWSGAIEDLPREPYRGRVDCLVGGFPCQDLSLAGSGGGIHGARSGLWFSMLDLACDLGCEWIASENVAAITVRGLDAVLGSLAEVGFDAEWLCLPASSVGASHNRDRWFCLAHRDRDEAMGDTDESRYEERGDCGRLRKRPSTERAGGEVGDTECADAGGGTGQEQAARLGGDRSTEPSGEVGDTGSDSGWRNSGAVPGAKEESPRQRIASGRVSDELRSSGDGIFAPGPNADWGRIVTEHPHLAPATQPGLRVLVDGLAVVLGESRADQLRCCGNGVVPAQACLAFIELFRRFGW